MTPTSDERREVAARLRENANKHGMVLDYLGSTQVASWWLLLHIIGCNSNEQEAAFRMLADLIDPTCHNRQIAYNRASPEEFRTDNFICSTCGELFCADPDGVNHPIDWAYCPNCGARVVTGDEAY